MNVTRGVKSAAVIEMTAKRSPIGNAISFLIQTKRRERSIARRRPRTRRASVGGGGTTGAGATTRPAGTTTSRDCSSGGKTGARATWRCASPKQKSPAWRTVWSVSAAPASSQTSSPAWAAPSASPANARYSFERSPIASSQAPKREKRRV